MKNKSAIPNFHGKLMVMDRKANLKAIENAFAVNPVCALLGPRQCGKSTLAAMYAKQQLKVNLFDLELPSDLARLENPELTLSELDGLIIIDEIQRRPELFPVLRVLIDRYKKRFLILGSASRDLINQSSETLAGRITHLELTPFSLMEVNDFPSLWIRGGFPLSYLAENDQISLAWRKAYVTTFLERDLPNLGFSIPAETIRRFWMMLTHVHGNIFNASELGRSLGYSDTTIKRYLDILVGTFMIRRLNPWFENIGKRQVKSPKIYFRDSGILHALMGIVDNEALKLHPKLGASWEGVALEEVIRYHKADPGDCYFWATHGHAELDLMIIQDGKRNGFEFKYTDSPKLTPSMKIALEDLKLNSLTVIIPGDHNFPLSENIRVIGLSAYIKILG